MRTLTFILAGALASASPFITSASAQQADTAVIRPGTNLVAEGIPAIPGALAAEVRRYTESRSAALADWHPARRELLISTRFGNTPQLHRVAMPLGTREQITFFEEPVGMGW